MITVLYITHESKSIGGSTLSLINLLRSVRSHVIPIVVCPDNGPATNLFREQGYKTFVVRYKLNIASSSFRLIKKIPRMLIDGYCNRKAIRQLISIAQEENVSIIHSNTGVLTIGYDLSKRINLKHVWHLREFQDLDFGFTPFCGWKKLKKMIDSTDAVIAITNAVANHFASTSQSNIHVINNAVRSCKGTIYLKHKDKYFLFCGHVAHNKGAEMALDIFVDFHRKHPGYTLLYAGRVTAEYQRFLIAKAEASDVSSSVRFLGFQQDVSPYFKKAAAFLMCSQCEALGRSTIEAMFYGCPVIGFNSGGTKEIIQDGINGYLFNNVTDAVSKLCYIIDNFDATRKIINAAHHTAISRFSEEHYGERIIRLYQSLSEN